MSTKEQLRRVLDELPDDCSLEDVMDELYVLEKARRGFESIDRDGGIPHEEVERRLKQWLAE